MKRKYIELIIATLSTERDEVRSEMSALEDKDVWARGDGRRMSVLNRQVIDLDGAIQRLESYIETL